MANQPLAGIAARKHAYGAHGAHSVDMAILEAQAAHRFSSVIRAPQRHDRVAPLT